MSDLFTDAAAVHQSQTAPLPQRIRPRSLDELVGQRHVLADGSALRLAIEGDRPPSMILYGPPGVGKTTLARIVAETTGAVFEELSAVSARVDDVRGVLQRARDRLGANGARTILFLDEIHRFNKGQQDALLPGVESGLLTLIGATTENPYFEVNAALLSRCAVVELEPLSDAEVAAVVGRGAAELEIEVPEDVVEAIVRKAGGDARSALSTLELSWQTAVAEGAPLEARHVADAARKRPLRYDRDGDQHYDIISAFIKSMRGERPRRGRVLPRRDARRRRGRALHRPPDGDPRLRGRRQRRSARARRRRCRRPGARARRAAGGAAEPGPGGDLPGQRTEVERVGAGDLERAERGARARHPGAAGRAPRLPTTPARGRAGTARATSRPTTTRLRPRRDHLPDGLEGQTYYVPSGNGEESGDGSRDG